jgi:hypothetical protein
MPNSRTYIVNDQATETDALDFTPYVETLADIIQTGDTPLTIACSARGAQARLR